MTRPAVERHVTGANLDGPEPSAVVRTAAHAIDARRRHAVNDERPIFLYGLNRAIEPREGRSTPFEDGKRIGDVKSPPSLADFVTTMFGRNFRYTQPTNASTVSD